jgi:hypothetical protein
MPRFFLLLIKRLLVLALLVGLSWFTVFKIFPFIDNQLPWGVAVLATYGWIAYIGLPALVRIWQLLHRPTHVPTRSHARDGWALDPINLVVIARNERDFVWAMQKAGWVQPDPLTLKSSLRTIRAVLLNTSYPTAPFSATYVFGKKQDVAFEIEIDGNPKNRHHVRFWRLGATLLDDEHEHRSFWHKLLSKFMKRKKEVWVGAASLETGVNLSRRTLQIVHKQEGDTDNERDFLVSTLKQAGVLRDAVGIKAGEPLHTNYQGFRESIIADGYVTLCELKRQFLPKA